MKQHKDDNLETFNHDSLWLKLLRKNQNNRKKKEKEEIKRNYDGIYYLFIYHSRYLPHLYFWL